LPDKAKEGKENIGRNIQKKAEPVRTRFGFLFIFPDAQESVEIYCSYLSVAGFTRVDFL
jgi:hypothetical protein